MSSKNRHLLVLMLTLYFSLAFARNGPIVVIKSARTGSSYLCKTLFPGYGYSSICEYFRDHDREDWQSVQTCSDNEMEQLQSLLSDRKTAVSIGSYEVMICLKKRGLRFGMELSRLIKDSEAKVVFLSRANLAHWTASFLEVEARAVRREKEPYGAAKNFLIRTSSDFFAKKVKERVDLEVWLYNFATSLGVPLTTIFYEQLVLNRSETMRMIINDEKAVFDETVEVKESVSHKFVPSDMREVFENFDELYRNLSHSNPCIALQLSEKILQPFRTPCSFILSYKKFKDMREEEFT